MPARATGWIVWVWGCYEFSAADFLLRTFCYGFLQRIYCHGFLLRIFCKGFSATGFLPLVFWVSAGTEARANKGQAMDQLLMGLPLHRACPRGTSQELCGRLRKAVFGSPQPLKLSKQRMNKSGAPGPHELKKIAHL